MHNVRREARAYDGARNRINLKSKTAIDGDENRRKDGEIDTDGGKKTTNRRFLTVGSKGRASIVVTDRLKEKR